MGKDFKGKEPGKEISQESTGLYSARFVEFRFAEVKKRNFNRMGRIDVTDPLAKISMLRSLEIKGFIGGI